MKYLYKTITYALLLPIFGIQGMIQEVSQEKSIQKPISKLESLRIVSRLIQSHLPPLQKAISNTLEKNYESFTLIAPQKDLKLTLPKKKIVISSILKNIVLNGDNYYGFDEKISQDAYTLLALYFKYYGTTHQKDIEQAILKSEYIVEIYHAADRLLMQPLVQFLNTNILEIFTKKGLINQILNEVGEKEFEERLDSYVCGHFHDILKECQTDPNYFDWNNPTMIINSTNISAITCSAIQSFLSNNGRYFAHRKDNYSIYDLYDTQTQQIIHTAHHTYFIESIAFSPDENYIASGSIDEIVQLYDINNRTVITIRHPWGVEHLEFTPDSRFIKCFSDNKCIIYDIQAQTSRLTDECNSIKSIDGKYRAQHPDDGKGYNGNRYEIIDLTNKKTIGLIQHKDLNNILMACFSPHGKYFNSTSNKMSHVYDIENKKPILIISGCEKYKGPNSFSGKDRYFGAISNENWEIHDLATQKIIHTIKPYNQKDVAYSIVFSPCGRSLATISKHNEVKIFKALSKKEIIQKIIQENIGEFELSIKILHKILHKMKDDIKSIEYKKNN